jgi:glycosyltransferase involved in cell wall biosynthesis
VKNVGNINLCVIVPVFNEQTALRPLLYRLLRQSDRNFAVIFVNNNSTDRTEAVLEDFIAIHGLVDWKVVQEPVKGTGAAADTGVRVAVVDRATHVARTDADCLPNYNWVAEIKKTFASSDLELIAGKITVRADDVDLRFGERTIFNQAVRFAGLFGKFRPLNRSPEYKGPYVMAAGCNIAFTTNLYERAGGFPRTKIENVHEDRALVNNVRKITDRYKYVPKVHVQMSARRATHWGLINTLKWYKDHSFKPEEVDLR